VENEKPVLTGNGLTWHLISYEDGGSGSIATGIYAAFASGSSTGANTWDFRGRTATYFNASFFQITGAYESGTIYDAFVQVITASGTGTSGSVTLPAAAGSADRCFATFGTRTNAAHTPRTNWTELDDASSYGSGDGLSTQYRSDAHETTASCSWSANEDWEGIAVEVREASVTTGITGYSMPHWRVRSDDSVALDANTGWAAAEDTAPTIDLGKKFRVRAKVQRDTTGVGDGFKLQCLHIPNGGAGTGWWDITIVALASSPNSCVAGKLSVNYVDGAATSTELLTSDAGLSWQNGEGVETAESTGNIVTGTHDLDNEETEFEWTIMMVNPYSQPMVAEVADGDKIYLRVVHDDGTAFPNLYSPIEITVNYPNGYVGGVFSECPKDVIEVDGNGKLYYVCEASEWEAETIMMASSDDGDTWAIVNRNNRPAEIDLESVDIKKVGTTLHIGMQLNNDPYYCTFNMSDAGSNPDTWQIQEFTKESVTRDDQQTAIVSRSDGTEIHFWEEVVSNDRRIIYRIRSSGGTWGSDNTLDSEASHDFTDCWAILGDSDLCHIFYQDLTDGELFHQTINSSDTLGTREEVGTNVLGQSTSEENAICGIVRYDSSGTDRIVVAYRNDSNSYIHCAKVDDNGSPSTPIAATGRAAYNDPVNSGSDQPVAHLEVDGTDLYVVFGDTNGEIWITKSADFAAFDTDTKIISNVEAYWLRTVVYTPSGGGTNLGIIYEDDSHGGLGNGHFYNYVIDSGSATLTVDDLSQSNTVSVPTLVQVTDLTVDDLSQDNTVDKVGITTIYNMAVGDLIQINQVTFITLSAPATLVIYDLSQSNFVDTVVISTGITADIDFEENDLSDFDTTQDAGSNLVANSSAALAGSSYGMEVTFDEFNQAYGRVTDASPYIQSGQIRLRFYFDPNSVSLASGNGFSIMHIAADGTYSFAVAHMRLEWNGSSYALEVTVKEDDDSDRLLTVTTFSDLDHYFELLVEQETSDGAANGVCRAYIDGNEVAGGLSDVENFNLFTTMTELRFGACFGMDAGDSGSFHMDEIIVRDDNNEIGAVDGLAVKHLSQGNIVELVNLTQVHTLQVYNLSQSNVVEHAGYFGIGINPYDMSQGNLVGHIPITTEYALAVLDLAMANTTERLSIVQDQFIVVNGLSQSNLIEHIIIQSIDTMSVLDLSQTNSVETFTLVQEHNIDIYDLSMYNDVDRIWLGDFWYEIHDDVGPIDMEHDVTAPVDQMHNLDAPIDREHDISVNIDQQEARVGTVDFTYADDGIIDFNYDVEGEL
jgi:hypothetical protein